jgi:hypothetical protein
LRVAAGGVLLIIAGSLARTVPPLHRLGVILLISGFGLLVVGALSWRNRRSRSAVIVERWARRSRHSSGVASSWAMLRRASRWAMLSRAHIMRPSLAEVPWWRRIFVPVEHYAVRMARVGFLTVYSPIEDVTLRVGGPRTGKSGEMADHIADAPGAVVATSTRLDLLTMVGPLRASRGPVYAFNPSGLGGVPSTISFDPLHGCTHPATAYARAEDMLGGTDGEGDRAYWVAQARRVLSGLLHAAALAGASMLDVLTWVAAPDTAKAIVTTHLRRSPAAAYVPDLTQFFATNDRTRSSISSTIMPALTWLTSEAATSSAGSGRSVDVEDLLRQNGTVFMLGADDGNVAPLVASLTGHIAREARRLASLQSAGRLDPPLTLALDEAALICPVPLDSWTADMGGRGITIHIAAQSRAQLRQRWGPNGAAAILNNAGTLLVYGGTRDPEDLTAWSTLSGDRTEPNLTVRVPVLSPAQVSQLPERTVLVIKRSMPAAVGVVRMAWRRADVRRAARTSPMLPALLIRDDAEAPEELASPSG